MNVGREVSERLRKSMALRNFCYTSTVHKIEIEFVTHVHCLLSYSDLKRYRGNQALPRNSTGRLVTCHLRCHITLPVWPVREGPLG